MPQNSGEDFACRSLSATHPAGSEELTVDLKGDRPTRSDGSSDRGVIAPVIFGGYELLEEVGRGGMGVVYRAREVRLDRIVALKMVLAGEFAGEDEISRFKAEAAAAAQLEHPRIVPVYDIGSVGSQHYYTMAYIPGTSLAAYRGRGVGDVRRAAWIVQQVAEAVAHAHVHRIIHRDLKPANVLLDADFCPRVTDFGLAKRADDPGHLTRTGQILGTPGYMAPEQAAGECREVGPQADVYAVGAVLYFALTGRPPFQAANVIDTLVQVLESEPTLPRLLNRQIPRPLEQICMRCLERVPRDRYESADALARDLDRFLQGQGVQARPPTRRDRVRRFARRSPALAAHLAALAMIQVVAQVYFAMADVDLQLHLQVSSLLMAWIAGSVALHAVGASKSAERVAGTVLLCCDAAMITVLLSLLSEPGYPPGPLVAGYPLIIVGGAMYFTLHRVAIVTVASVVSYLILLAVEPHLISPIHYNVCFVIMMLTIAVCVGHQVRRVRMLSDYFETRRG